MEGVVLAKIYLKGLRNADLETYTLFLVFLFT